MGNEIVISEALAHRTFSKRVEGYEGKYILEELDSSSVGEEKFWLDKKQLGEP